LKAVLGCMMGRLIARASVQPLALGKSATRAGAVARSATTGPSRTWRPFALRRAHWLCAWALS
jgi:hypothetical protein